MNVLSLFDGISCGQQALKELGIPVDKYYASEIDKHAIAITQYQHPDTIQLGDIENWEHWGYCNCAEHQHSNDFDWSKIDLIQGGSPCQGFSFAGKQLNFDDPRSKLFFKFVDILNNVRKYNPDVKFLLENVRMRQEYQDIISEALGVQPVLINSALVSAQNRQRLYWTNIGEIDQPDDKGILLKDVLESDDDLVMCTERRTEEAKKIRREHRKKTGKDFSPRRGKELVARTDDKSNCLTTGLTKEHIMVMRVPEATKKGYADAKAGEGLDLTFINSKTRRGRLMRHKSNCLTAGTHEMGVVRAKSKCMHSSGRGSYDRHEWDSVGDKGTELYWRKLTPLECERLQTLPDRYTAFGAVDKLVPELGTVENVFVDISNTQRYKALGNGWTVAVIKHIYKSL
ncbi:MAG: DNA (cytosine-5-)-methyltransferase [Gammaproteobacteria bacterium]|nr:DNA (cytosine-5-)-methyltransferase [Gammaproteobacteria bacterium]